MPLDILPIFYLCAIFILHILYLFSSFFSISAFLFIYFCYFIQFYRACSITLLVPLAFLYKKAAKTFLSNAFAAFLPLQSFFFIRWNSVQFLCASLFLFFFQLSPDRIFRCCHCLQGHGKKLFQVPSPVALHLFQ